MQDAHNFFLAKWWMLVDLSYPSVVAMMPEMLDCVQGLSFQLEIPSAGQSVLHPLG